MRISDWSSDVCSSDLGPAQRAYFTIKREEWVREGLEAYLALRLDTHMSLNDSEFHRRALAVMMRRLAGLASDYADRRLSRMPGGFRWSPVQAVVQVLPIGRASGRERVCKYV